MSRKDTIIIAVLVNAGLLIVLFASALKTNSPVQDVAANMPPAPIIQEVQEPAFKKEAAVSVVGDEVDVALNQFAQNSTPALAAQPQQPSSFADDLKTFTLPETPVSPATAPVQTLAAVTAPDVNITSEFIEVKVKKGDVLEKIARQHRTSVAEIMKINKLASSNLRIGQVLKIPNKSIKKAEASAVALTTSAASDAGTKFYTVKKGDNPWTIAVKNHLKVEDLLKLNHMTEDQARRLKPGDQLRIK